MNGGGLGKWRTPLLVGLMTVGALLRLAAFHHHRAVDYDEGRYLDNAVNILKGRGLATHYTSHFFRPSDVAPLHPEDISSPLYPYLLAGTFSITGPELRPAQLWSLLPGCLMIWLTFLLGRRLFDERTALLAAVLVALNPDMAILSSWAMTESLYGALLLGLLLLASRPIAEGREARRWIVLGLSCGAIYLLRANGLAVAAAFGLTALVPERTTSARDRLTRAVLFGACFLACVSPWLVRNQRLFGSPTFTAMKNVAWSESGRDLFRRDRPPPSMQSFRREHGDAALVKNVVQRGWRATRYLFWGDTGAYNFVCLLYPIALALTWRVPGLRTGHLCVLLSTLLLVGVPLWTGALSRYMLPLRPWIYLTVIGAAAQIVPELVWRRNVRRVSKGSGAPVELPLSTEPARRLTLATVATIVALVAWGSSRPLREFIEKDETARDILARETAHWILRNTPEQAVLMEGAYIHQYAFLYDRAVVWAPAGGLDEIRRAAADYHAHYLIVSGELLRFRPELGAHFQVTEGAVHEVDLPQGFDQVYAGAGRRVVIWKLAEGPA